MTTLFADENGVSCFVDQNGVTCFIDQNGVELCCPTPNVVTHHSSHHRSFVL